MEKPFKDENSRKPENYLKYLNFTLNITTSLLLRARVRLL